MDRLCFHVPRYGLFRYILRKVVTIGVWHTRLAIRLAVREHSRVPQRRKSRNDVHSIRYKNEREDGIASANQLWHSEGEPTRQLLRAAHH
jgi:hypothetical protein